MKVDINIVNLSDKPVRLLQIFFELLDGHVEMLILWLRLAYISAQKSCLIGMFGW